MNSPELRFRPLAGPALRTLVTTQGDRTVIGRDAPGIALPDQRVSRRHATLAHEAGRWMITDHGSRNGTWLNTARLDAHRPTLLGERDLVGIGPWVFRAMSTETRTGQGDGEALTRLALDLPRRLERVEDEAAVLDVACSALVTALRPLIGSACAFVLPRQRGRRPQLIAMSCRGNMPLLEEVGSEGRARVSRRAVRRACVREGEVVLIERETQHVAAVILDRTTTGRPVILHATADELTGDMPRRVVDTMDLVATLARRQLTSLRQARLGRCFSPTVVNTLMKRGGDRLLENAPRVMEATSLFFDLRGSSRCAEQADSIWRLHADLRRVMDLVTRLVFEFDGTVVDYAGDGLFAAWGVPLAQPDQTDRAVRCAMRIVEALGQANTGLYGQAAGDGPVCGIGIDRGPVLAGAGGSVAQLKYGVFGPSVNTAARLEGLSKPAHFGTPIVMSGAARAALTDASLVVRGLGRTALAGMDSEIEVFAPITQDVCAPAPPRRARRAQGTSPARRPPAPSPP